MSPGIFPSANDFTAVAPSGDTTCGGFPALAF
jgi:hypothetical protein